MKHPFIQSLESIYGAFQKNQLAAAQALCSEQMTLQISGKSKLAGKYTRETLGNYFDRLRELSGQTYQLEVHDILASDVHATVLGTASVTKNGKKEEYRVVHVWRFQNGQPLAWYEYPRDLYAFDAIWA